MVSIPMHHRGTLLTVGNKLVPIDFTNLQALYTFGEGSELTLYDRSGNGNNGTITGATTWQFNTTRKKYVLSFDGIDNEIDMGDTLHPTNDIVYVAGCIYPTGFGDGSPVIMNKSDEYWLQCEDDGTGNAEFKFVVVVGGTNYIADWAGSYSLNQWLFVEGMYDGSEVTVSVNRTQLASTSTTGSIDDTTNSFAIGYYTGGGHHFEGRIGISIVYFRAPTSGERDSLYNKTKP